MYNPGYVKQNKSGGGLVRLTQPSYATRYALTIHEVRMPPSVGVVCVQAGMEGGENGKQANRRRERKQRGGEGSNYRRTVVVQ